MYVIQKDILMRHWEQRATSSFRMQQHCCPLYSEQFRGMILGSWNCKRVVMELHSLK